MRSLVAFLLLIIVLLQHKLWFGDGNLREIRQYQQRIKELKREGARLSERNEALEAEVIDLKKGLEAVEERARRDLGMIKDGETFYQVIEEDK